jgi:hypothetical protein
MLEYAPAALFAVLSYNFYMSGFFLISGYVMAASLVTKSMNDTLSSRIMALGVPFIVGLLIINPVTLAIMFGGFGSAEYWAELQARFADRSIIVHLWFVISFCDYHSPVGSHHTLRTVALGNCGLRDTFARTVLACRYRAFCRVIARHYGTDV